MSFNLCPECGAKDGEFHLDACSMPNPVRTTLGAELDRLRKIEEKARAWLWEDERAGFGGGYDWMKARESLREALGVKA